MSYASDQLEAALENEARQELEQTIKEKIIYFSKLRDDAIIPTKNDEDGWYDVYANFPEDGIVIDQHEIALIPAGIASAFNKKYRIKFSERGSNTKSKLAVRAGCIDSGYRGEWLVALYNTQHIPIEITKQVDDYEYRMDLIRVPYSKAICQFGIEEVPSLEEKEIPYDELVAMKSERMFGKLGSTNK